MEFGHWTKAKRISAYSIAYVVPLVLSIAGFWLTSVAAPHLHDSQK